MWGALIFLLLFLVIDPTTREMMLAGIDDARLRLAVEAPWPYFVLVIVIGSAMVSALIMRFWPRTEDATKRVQILHRYQGRTPTEPSAIQQTPSFGLLVMELTNLVLPVRARVACGRLLRNRWIRGI